MAGPKDSVVIGWLRRGRNNDGRRYDKEAVLRRAIRNMPNKSDSRKDRSQDGGAVVLLGLDQGNEPVLIANRRSLRSTLFALSSGTDSAFYDIKISSWELPEPTRFTGQPGPVWEEPENRSDLICGGQKIPPSWLHRTASIFQMDDGQMGLLFSRAVQNEFALDALWVVLTRYRECHVHWKGQLSFNPRGEKQDSPTTTATAKVLKTIETPRHPSQVLRSAPLTIWSEDNWGTMKALIPLEDGDIYATITPYRGKS